MPLIGTVPARGRTTAEIEADDRRSACARAIVRNPDVSVEVDRYRPFFAMGEVGAAGQYPYVPGMTVQQAVAIAGGFTPRADKYAVQVTRSIDGADRHRHARRSTDPILPGDTSTSASASSERCIGDRGAGRRRGRDRAAASSIASARRSAGSSATSATSPRRSTAPAMRSASSATPRPAAALEDALLASARAVPRARPHRVPMRRQIAPSDLAAAWRIAAQGAATRSRCPARSRRQGRRLRAGDRHALAGNWYPRSPHLHPHGGSLHYDAEVAAGPRLFRRRARRSAA